MASQNYNVSKNGEKRSTPRTAEETRALTETNIDVQAVSIHQANSDKPASETLAKNRSETNDESNNFTIFLSRCFWVLCKSAAGLICFGIGQCIPIAMIVIGSIYLHDCPRQRFIPIYLIVSGCFLVAGSLFEAIKRHCCKRKDENNENISVKDLLRNPLGSLVLLFTLAWLIAGSVWIYSIRNDYDSEDPTSEKFCHPVLFKFSFWMTTAQYILLAIGMVILSCICCFSAYRVYKAAAK